MELIIHVFMLNEEGPADAEDGDEATPSYSEWQLPARAFCGLWESLIYGEVWPCFPGFCTETSRGCTENRPGCAAMQMPSSQSASRCYGQRF